MEINFKFQGLATGLPPYDAPDGSLQDCYNLVNENGVLKAITAPKALGHIPEDAKVMCVQVVGEEKRFITYNGTKLAWQALGEDDITVPVDTQVIAEHADVKQVTPVGNSLVVATENDTYYYLWRENGYHLLGTHLPEIGISFGLQGYPKLFCKDADEDANEQEDPNHYIGGRFRVIRDGYPPTDGTEFSLDMSRVITEQVYSKLNKFIYKTCTSQNRFCQPFFIRYAIRLYDGTLVHHSAPIFMEPMSGGPTVRAVSHGSDCDYADIFLMACDVDYKVVLEKNQSLADFTAKLDAWEDIITSVDVFVSQPLSGMSDRIKRYVKAADPEYSVPNYANFCGRLMDTNIISPNGENGFSFTPAARSCYAPWNIYAIELGVHEWERTQLPNGTWVYCWGGATLEAIPDVRHHTFFSNTYAIYNEIDQRKQIEDCSTFFKVATLKPKDLKIHIANVSNMSNGREVLAIESHALENLTAREAMTDDFQSHDKIVGTSMVYNGRLHVVDSNRYLYKGENTNARFGYLNGQITYECQTNADPETWERFNPEEHGLHSPGFKPHRYDYAGPQFIGPNGVETAPVTTSVYVNHNGTSHKLTTTSEILNTSILQQGRVRYFFYPNAQATHVTIDRTTYKLTPHAFLNGAYAFLEQKSIVEPPTNFVESNVIEQPNKLYTSDPLNPFLFRATGTNTIGTGRIIGLASAARPLSEGQFGQFPLYAFTEDGIWALSVNEDGGYVAKNPISREVCISAKSITSLDSSVLFLSNRGLMQLNGSQVECLSDAVNNIKPMGDIIPFLEYIDADTKLLYDYTHSRVYIFNPKHGYGYVLSLKSGAWARCTGVQDVIGGYPDALAMKEQGRLVDFASLTETCLEGHAITMPLKLNAPDIHKAVNEFYVRGNFNPAHVSDLHLYASNDPRNWKLLAKSNAPRMRGIRGSGWKYFRIGFTAQLDADESISGVTGQATPKYTNHMR